MRILTLAQFYPPMIGGEERHVRNLSVEFTRRGHEVHVATLRLGESAPPPVDDPGVTVHELDSLGRKLPGVYADSERPMALPLPDPVLTRELYRLGRSVRADVVHAHNWIVNSYLPVKRRLRAPLVLSLHDYSHVCATKRLMLDEQPCPGPSPARCLPCAGGHYGKPIGTTIWAAVRAGRPVRDRLVDRFTPVSHYVASASGLVGVDGSMREDTEIVANFVPDELAAGAGSQRDPLLPAGDFYFFAGDLSNQKGLSTLLAAYQRLTEPKLPLLMVGRWTADLPEEVPAGVVVHRGWTHDRVLNAFRHCRAAVLPSVWPDPCPTTVLEALSLGAAVVTTQQGGIADMVEPDRSALVVRPGDVAELAAALTAIATDDVLHDRLAAAGHEAVKPFRCSSVADQLEGIYRKLTEEDQRAH
jgi:glycosyltransferase involved in cell wall biosynthesis